MAEFRRRRVGPTDRHLGPNGIPLAGHKIRRRLIRDSFVDDAQVWPVEVVSRIDEDGIERDPEDGLPGTMLWASADGEVPTWYEVDGPDGRHAVSLEYGDGSPISSAELRVLGVVPGDPPYPILSAYVAALSEAEAAIRADAIASIDAKADGAVLTSDAAMDTAATAEFKADTAVTAADGAVVTAAAAETKADAAVLDAAAARTGAENAAIGYETRALLFADLTPDENTIAVVTNDPDPLFNGAYRKVGATGEGSWMQASNDRVTLAEYKTLLTAIRSGAYTSSEVLATDADGVHTAIAVTLPSGGPATIYVAEKNADPPLANGYDLIAGDTIYTQPTITRDESGNPLIVPPLIVVNGLATPTRAWDAVAITGLADTDPAPTFPDRTAAASHATSTGDARATYRTGVINGRPVLRFDGVDDQYTFALIADVANFDLWLLGSFADFSNRSIIGGGSPSVPAFIRRTNATAWRIEHTSGASTVTVPTDTAGVAALHHIRVSGDTVTIRRNGVVQGTASISGTFVFDSIGRKPGTTPHRFAGDMSALHLSTTGLSLADALRHGRYLMALGGILPGD